ncbi:MAG: GDYXXLXY domain-containing protein [Helicobacteraceae bacterium]
MKTWLYITALLQMIFLGALLLTYENVLARGKTVFLNARIIDPAEVFKGRFLSLRTDLDTLDVNLSQDLPASGKVFVVFKEDGGGELKISSIETNEPEQDLTYLATQASSVFSYKIRLKTPLDRYYMNERLAVMANDMRRLDLKTPLRVRAKILRGRGTIDGLYVGDETIENYLKNTQRKGFP